MKRMGSLAAAVAAAGFAFAGSTGVALGASGAQQAQAFAQAEVGYYANQLPAPLRANPGAAGTSVDSDCFSAAYSHVDPRAASGGTPANPLTASRRA